MTNIFQLQKSKATYLLLVLICVSGCGKEENDFSTATKGDIKGKIRPGTGAESVVATPTFSAPILTMLTDDSGNFAAKNVATGLYVITINPVKGFEKPAPIRKSVKPRQTLDLGTIEMTPVPLSGNVSFTLDGANFSLFPPFTFAEYNTPNFLVKSQTAPSNVDHISVVITLDNVNGTGTFQLNNSVNSTIRILQQAGSNLYTWSTVKGGSGSVTISTLNTVTRICSGTFSVSAVAENNTTPGTKTIANGSFTNLSF